MNLREIAERMSRGIVLKRRLPREFRNFPIYVTPEAGLRYWRSMPKADPMLYRMAKELIKKGANVWDVGANVGLFSICASALAGASGSVLALEPDFWLCHLLAKSARIAPSQGGAPITVLCAAASNACAVAKLQISERCRAANHLDSANGSGEAAGTRLSQSCVTVSLDALLEHYSPPDILKIDVETHELEVLRGARELLQTARPRIWCEVCPANAVAVFELLRSYGYEVLAAATPEPRTALLKRASWDTLAVPKEWAKATAGVA